VNGEPSYLQERPYSELVDWLRAENERLRWTRVQMPEWNDLPAAARKAGVAEGAIWANELGGDAAVNIYAAIRAALTAEGAA
jgi:hypothetical protein